MEWPADHVERRLVADLIPYARNSRTHSAEQVSQIAASIREWGWTTPVLIDEDGMIIAGHGRVMAAQKLGIAEIPVMVASGWTEAQRRAYVIADNKLAENAGWDHDALKIELAELKGLDFDLPLIGFDAKELDKLLAQGPQPGMADPDAVPDTPAAPITRAGDIWLLGNHRVMCGDSTDQGSIALLMAGDMADFCITSPPYNAAITSGSRMGNKTLYDADGYADNLSSQEYIDFNRKIFAAMASVASDDFICCYNINYNKNSPSEYLDVAAAGREFFALRETICWKKHIAVSLAGNNLTRIYEFVFVYAKGELRMNKRHEECERNLWEISNVGANHAIHKAAFPVGLAEKAITLFCPPKGIIIEPFGGTGTTCVAAEALGRQSRLMELDPKYCDVIVKRWQDFTGNEATLEGDGRTFAAIAADRTA